MSFGVPRKAVKFRDGINLYFFPLQGMLTMLFCIRSNNCINGDVKHILFVTTEFLAAVLIKFFTSNL
jgi:hypothetical protein